MGAIKRGPGVPEVVAIVAGGISKADLLEAVWDLAGLCNEAGSVDDDASTLRRLIDAVNVRRVGRDAKPIDLAKLAAKLGVCGRCNGTGVVRFGSVKSGPQSAPCEGCARRPDVAILEEAAALPSAV